MSTAILIPSLNRPHRIRFTAQVAHEATPEDHTIYWMVSDLESISLLNEMGEMYNEDATEDDRRYVTRMNKLVRVLGDEDQIFFGSDDIVFHPGWLREAQRVLDNNPKLQLVVVNDLRNRNGTQGLIRREYLEQATFDAPGDAFHAGYQHNFADTEQFLLAEVKGVFGRAMDSFVEHLHPVMNGPRTIPWDETYTNAQKGWAEDQARFEGRARQIIETFAPA